jgi:hypothetical protein
MEVKFLTVKVEKIPGLKIMQLNLEELSGCDRGEMNFSKNYNMLSIFW